MSDSAYWSVITAPWTVDAAGSGIAVIDGSQVATKNIIKYALFTIGKLYKVVWTVQNRTAGRVQIRCGNAGIGTGWQDTNDTFTEYIVAAGSTHFFIYADTDFIGEVDNVTVQEITHLGTDGCLVVSAKNGSTQNWNKDAGFSENDPAGYTFTIQRSGRHHNTKQDGMSRP